MQNILECIITSLNTATDLHYDNLKASFGLQENHGKYSTQDINAKGSEFCAKFITIKKNGQKV